MDAPCLYPREIDKMMTDIKAEMKTIESRRHVTWDRKVERELTDAEREAVKILGAKLRELERQKYGTVLP